MKKLEDLNLLIDKASAIAGSDYKLAQMLGTQRQVISDWRHGRKTAAPADQALMAHVAGLDPLVTLARATVEQHEGKAKGDALMKALGKALPAIGGVLGSAGAHATSIGSTTAELWQRVMQYVSGKKRERNLPYVKCFDVKIS